MTTIEDVLATGELETPTAAEEGISPAIPILRVLTIWVSVVDNASLRLSSCIAV
ncbi:hypothetical protein [Methyloprofundus sedimenti]|uniref:hypothetical protein n=1 Tax=Methyloprofundus sedimenti TaxID=1420851 RepID=UPI001E6445B7|nr:hypothetical protein [Methyloprofundus sedimenti]